MKQLKLLLAAALLWPVLLQAQSGISLEALLDSAASQNRELQVLQLEIEKAQKQNLPYNGIGRTTLQYSFGQLDGPSQDYQIQVQQNLGNPWAGLANAQLRQAAIESSKMGYELNKAWLQMQVYSAYAEWLSAHRQLQTRQQAVKTYRHALAVAQNQFDEGQINTVELAFAKGRYTAAVQEESMTLQQMLESRYRLEQFTQLNLSNRQPLPIGPPLKNTEMENTSLYQNYYKARKQVAEEQENRSKAEFFPTFYTGYTNQQLNLIPGYEAVFIGAYLPLFNVSTYQNRQLAIINQKQQLLEADQQLWQRSSRLAVLIQQKNNLIEQLTELGSAIDIRQGLETIRQRYEMGESNLLELSQNVSTLITAEINYEKLMMKLHQLQAEIEYLNAKA